jgi:phosphomannomutase
MKVLFAYEEALGYCIGDIVPDKDGISAANVFLEMYKTLEKGTNESASGIMYQHLQSLYQKYGEFISFNSYVFCEDKTVISTIFSNLRNCQDRDNEAIKYIPSCCGVRILSIQDITMGYDINFMSNSMEALEIPSTPENEMLMFTFENHVTMTLRTSGTEPKIKYYTEIKGDIGQKRSEIQQNLMVFVNNVLIQMLEPERYGLTI